MMSGRNKGFTLLEMSIVLTIVAILVGGGLAVFMATIQRQQLQETYDKMQAINEAIHKYRVAFNRLPCPADATMPIDEHNFGMEAENKETCNGTPDANFHSSSSDEEAPHMGMVPTKTLRLPDEYAFDGWGRRLMYAVSGEMTQENAFSVIIANDLTERMIIKDAAGGSKSTIAAYVLLSYGDNGHGAFPRFGGAARVNASSLNLDELENCDCGTNLTPSDLDGEFVQKDRSRGFFTSRDIFDDVVMYGTRADLRTIME